MATTLRAVLVGVVLSIRLFATRVQSAAHSARSPTSFALLLPGHLGRPMPPSSYDVWK